MDPVLVALAITAIFAAFFFINVLPGERVADALNASPVTLPEGSLRARVLRRPRFLSGRLLVAIWFLALFAVTAAPVLAQAVAADDRRLLTLAALGIFLAVSVVVLAWQRSLAQQPRARLDERERNLQGTVHVLAYRVVAWLLGAALAAGIGAVLVGWHVDIITIPWDESQVVDYLLVGSLVLSCLPSLVHAWLEPRPDAEEDESSAPRAGLR